VSEIRGMCDFCMNADRPPTYAPCAFCRRDPRKPDWRASKAGMIALRLEADLAAVRAELARRKPEERVGECFCESPSSRLRWLQHGRSFICVEPCWINEDTDDTYPPGCFCQDCGAELCADGIARRNSDTARVDALVRASRGCVGWRLHYHPGHPPADWVLHTIMPDGMYTGETLRGALDTIRVALDPEVRDGE
jgi:hypothetical protein